MRIREIEMKKLKTVLVQGEGGGHDFGALVSTCSQCVEVASLDGGWRRIQKDKPEDLTCDFPKLRHLMLKRVEMKPLLALLCSPPVLEEVILVYVDFISIKGLQYDVTSDIKDLKLWVADPWYTYGDSENYLAAMFEFLGKCSARTGRMVINNREVERRHLLQENFTVFKEIYVRVAESDDE